MLELVGIRLADARLGAAHEVVAEQPDRAAGERRQAVERRDPPAAQLLGDEPVGIGVLAEHQPDHRARAEAEERPAPDLLTLLGRLEQERGAVAAQLQVGRDRRLAVGDECVAQRHERVLARQLAHLVEARRQAQPADVSGDGH